MPQRYELKCSDCQQVLPVETRHAGQQIPCPNCSATLTIGTLREIRQLPPIEETTAQPGTKANWSASRKWMFVVGMLLIAVGLVWGAINLLQGLQPVYNAPRPDHRLSASQRSDIDRFSPAQTLASWQQIPFDDVLTWEEPGYLKLHQYGIQKRWVGYLGLSIAGAGLLLVLGAIVLRI